MRRQNRCALIAAILLALLGAAIPCGARDLSRVRLIQRPIEDAARAENAYVEGWFRYQDRDRESHIVLGPYAAMNVGENIEAGGSVGLKNVDPSRGDSESGFLDLDIYGRYALDPIETDAGRVLTTVGLLVSLPTGSEDIREGTFDVEAFGAGRYVLDGYAVTGHAGLRFNGDFERGSGNAKHEIPGEVSVLLGAGAVLPVGEAVALTGEFNLETGRLEGWDSVVQITPGIDASAGEKLHLRGGLGIGLTNEAPDIELILGLAADL